MNKKRSSSKGYKYGSNFFILYPLFCVLFLTKIPLPSLRMHDNPVAIVCIL